MDVRIAAKVIVLILQSKCTQKLVFTHFGQIAIWFSFQSLWLRMHSTPQTTTTTMSINGFFFCLKILSHFSCLFNLAFADRSNLRAHMQTHSADKNFECQRCHKTFALKSYLNKHLESSCFSHENDGNGTVAPPNLIAMDDNSSNGSTSNSNNNSTSMPMHWSCLLIKAPECLSSVFFFIVFLIRDWFVLRRYTNVCIVTNSPIRRIREEKKKYGKTNNETPVWEECKKMHYFYLSSW